MDNLSSVSKEKISKKDTIYYTISELIKRLNDGGIDWDNIPNIEKYGSFYKLKKKKSKLYISPFSETFDGVDTKKYMTYLFGG